MKVNKKQLEALIRESVEEEISNLNEEELDELLGGLRGLAGSAGAGLKRAAGAVGGAVGGVAKGAMNAVGGAVRNAAGAVQGAYQAGEAGAAVQNVGKGIQAAIAAADKAIKNAGQDQNLVNKIDNVKGILAHAGEQLAESGTRKKILRRKTNQS